VTETPDGLIIQGRPQLDGGTVNPAGDHRIAMAAAVAACGCKAPVRVLAPRCVGKSYPGFWDDLEQL
jgi:3-phosphoshikimate 1-carboxyvinyltransferase